MPAQPEIRIVCVLFDQVDAQDLIGAYEVLHRLPGARMSFVASAPGSVRAQGGLTLIAEHAFADAPRADLVIVPGGPGELPMREHAALLELLRSAHASGAWIAAVCTGALLLGAAGLLRGRRVATHWLATGELAQFGATPAEARYVIESDGKLASSAGVSAGIDMALALAAQLCTREVAEAIQLGIEYDPRPPFQAGSPERAPADLVQRLRAGSRFESARHRSLG